MKLVGEPLDLLDPELLGWSMELQPSAELVLSLIEARQVIAPHVGRPVESATGGKFPFGLGWKASAGPLPMNFDLSPRAVRWLARLEAFQQRYLLPHNAAWHAAAARGEHHAEHHRQ